MVLRAWYDPASGAFYIDGEGMKNIKRDILDRLIPLYEIIKGVSND